MRWGAAAAAIAALGALLFAQAAAASTQVGNVCTANKMVINAVAIQLANASSALPIEAPAGVVTEWKVSSTLQTSERLKVVAPTGPKDTYRLVAESAEENAVPGVNAYNVRIPVPAGARFGLYGPPTGGALICESIKAGDVMGIHGGDFLVTDAPEQFFSQEKLRVAVSAVIEPDVDGDGFGDETQDKCPQSAAFQAACPQIALELFPVVEKSSVTLVAIADHEAPVTVSASVVTPKIPKAKKKKKKRALSSAKLTIQGGTQTVVPNHLAKFKLPFPSKLKSELKALPTKKSATMTITATATNLVGQTSITTTTVKVKGQAKAK